MSKIDHTSPAVHSSLSILQDVITRMAGNSASAKTWCIALVSASLVLLADRKSPDLVWLAAIPIILFFLLDAYYLGLEKEFRDSYNNFIKKIHTSDVSVDDLFVVVPPGQKPLSFKNVWQAFKSFSVWPFYLVQLVVLLTVRLFMFQ